MLLHRAHFRFGLGPSPAEAASPPAAPREHVLRQLDQPTTLPPSPGLPSAMEAVGLFLTAREDINTARRERVQPHFVGPFPISGRELLHRVAQAQATATPLHERLALHWCNHFAVTDANKTGFFAGAMEREAIRPNMLGRFHAMLRGCTTHPAMLFFLDNRVSAGPNSAEGQRRRRGLNENLGRELLELHTLGVDGGYTQQDVQEVARILTGWTVHVEARGRPLEERIGFDPALHEPGPRQVLGKRYPDAGPEQLELLLVDLCRHPATARHVTRRLVRHFVGDQAPPALAQRLAGVFRDTDGDLVAVTRAMLRSEQAWTTPATKLRPPVQLLFSAARMVHPERPAPRGALRAMGQAWQNAPSPAGWPEEDNSWVAADSVKTRLDWALEVASHLSPVPDARRLAEQAFGDGLSAETKRAIERAASGGQAMTLLLMSPEFQRR